MKPKRANPGMQDAPSSPDQGNEPRDVDTGSSQSDRSPVLKPTGNPRTIGKVGGRNRRGTTRLRAKRLAKLLRGEAALDQADPGVHPSIAPGLGRELVELKTSPGRGPRR